MLYLKLNKTQYINLEKARDLSKLVKKVIIDKNGNRKTVYVMASEDLNVKRSLMIEKNKWFMDEKNNNVNDLINFMRKQDIEYCCVSNDGKEAFFKKHGFKDEIKFENKELNKIKNSKFFIHNHPKGTSFSLEDISLALNNNIRSFNIVSEINKRKINYNLTIRKEIDEEMKNDFINDYVDALVVYVGLGDNNPQHRAMKMIIDSYSQYIRYDYYESR